MRTSERTSRVAKLKYFGKQTKSGIAGKLSSAAKTENLGTSLRNKKKVTTTMFRIKITKTPSATRLKFYTRVVKKKP